MSGTITDSYDEAEAHLPRRTTKESKRRKIKLPGEADTTAAESVSENEEKESEATTKRKTAQNKSGTPMSQLHLQAYRKEGFDLQAARERFRHKMVCHFLKTQFMIW